MKENENELITNKENNFFNLEDENLIQKVDEYNINQLLMNLFKRLIMKCETQEIKNNQISSILPILIEKIKSNYPNFFFSLQEPNDNFGLFYTTMNNLIQEYRTSSNFTETDGFSLLGFFEEEIRNFFQTHPFLLKNAFISQNEKNNNKHEIENKIKDITNLIKENNELIDDIYNDFKNAHTTEKQKYVDYINQQHAKISEILDDIKMYSFNSMNSEQSFKNFEKFKENLLKEQKDKEEEIKYCQSLLNRYTSQGDQMTQLLNEYKRYSNMINCLKDNNNNI